MSVPGVQTWSVTWLIPQQNQREVPTRVHRWWHLVASLDRSVRIGHMAQNYEHLRALLALFGLVEPRPLLIRVFVQKP